MASRITVWDGFGVPRKRKHHRKHHRGGARAQQSKMKKCAIKWKHARGGSYRSFMRKCLKKGHRA